MKRIVIAIYVLSFAGCATSNVHPIVCDNIERCYDSAASKCRGHWTQVAKPGEPYPYAEYKDGTYTFNVRCTKPSE